MSHQRCAFVSLAPVGIQIPTKQLKRPRARASTVAIVTKRRCRPVACDRDTTVSSASTPAGDAPGSTSTGSEQAPSSASRTLVGRIVVEVLSLVVGAALLLVVVVWRASQVVSQAAWRALLWLSNVRRLGKWAFARVAEHRVPTVTALQAVRDAVVSLFARLPAGSKAPQKEATSDASVKVSDSSVKVSDSSVKVEQLVSKEELDNVQREIDRMKDLIQARGNAVAQTVARDPAEAVQTRRLILLRHAKTMWENNEIPDHDRVLSAQGKEEARVIGLELAKRAWVPDIVLCSDAVRTVQTLSLLDIPEKDGQADTLCTESLYYAVTGEEMAVALDDALGEQGFVDRTTLLVVCHNPGCEELVEQLTGERTQMGTGCAALLEFVGANGDQRQENVGSFRLFPQQNVWRLVEVLRPSTLTASSKGHKGINSR